MKLSEMTNDQASRFLIRVSQPIASIMDDDKMQPILDTISKVKSVPMAKLVAQILPPVVAFAIKDHKNDLYEIIGAFADKPVKAVGSMNIMETMRILKDSVDKDFMDFFNSPAPNGGTAGE